MDGGKEHDRIPQRTFQLLMAKLDSNWGSIVLDEDVTIVPHFLSI
jgi:hypothetical protein